MVAIKGMEMPKSCTQCNMTYEDRRLHDICQLNYTDVGYHIGNQTKPVDCPLVEIVTCKDCKHWKDSDGVYRRGIGAESKCPINIKEVFEGNFYCPRGERKE